MRRILLAIAVLSLCFAGAAARADDLNVESNFIDTSNQNPTLCIHLNEALKPGLDAHYEDYVRVDNLTGIVTQVSGNNLCIGGVPYQKHYTVTLLAGLPAQNGDKLDSDSKVDFAPGDRPPLVAISGNGLYLAKRSAGGLAITSVNIKKLAIHVLRLNDLNAIQDFAASQNGNSFDPTQQTLSGYTLSSMAATQAGMIWSGSMEVKPQPDTAVQTLSRLPPPSAKVLTAWPPSRGFIWWWPRMRPSAAPPGFWTGTLNDNDSGIYSGQSFSTIG